MPPLTLEGDTLGKKHQHFNKLVEDAITNKQYELSKINTNDGDIENLLKIDIASKTRNVNFIIEVFKSNDMLYASKAIKKSTWLITDLQYADIINPKYLHTRLFPNMTTKAVNKLMLHIRLNLKDDNRVETFYEYLKETDDAYKWLQNCSIPFIENVIQNERRIPLSLFKRLCRRSITFLAYHKRVEERSQSYTLREILFLAKKHTAEVLKLLEDESYYYLPKIGRKNTVILMKTYPQIILNNIERYVEYIDLSVVAKHLNKDEIISFLYKQMKNDRTKYYFRKYSTLKHFVKNIPKEKRFEFIKKMFIDKSNVQKDAICEDKEYCVISCDMDSYHWYQYGSFNVAFTDLKKIIRADNSPTERSAILSVLITCANRNQQHIKTLLKYYYEKHINEPFKFKIQFVNNVLTQTATHEFDRETWNILDQLFHSLEVYTESENNVQMCLKSIILYKVLHDEKVPDIVEKKILYFDTFKNYHNKLNEEQKDKLFSYLYNSIIAKLQNQKLANQCDFNDNREHLHNALNLLKYWKKDIKHYPFVLSKIQELIKIKKEKSWNIELAGFYNVNKSWRKDLFQESLILCPSEETCLNALKHEPQLLTRHGQEVEALRSNDAVFLRRLLAKLRVYWSHSIAQQWIDAYLQNLNKPMGQKALIKGLFVLLPQEQLIEMAKKYVPVDYKINWGEADHVEIRLRQNIAKHLHVARPMTPLDTVLWYAKGDYLQYAVPSLNAILHNLSKVQCRESLPKLLDAPVSLQKFGLHLAFITLNSEELKLLFFKVWTNTNNSTIRTVLFMHTFDLMCKVKNPKIEKELWELLSMFIENLSTEENKEIYKKLGRVKDVPITIQSKFFMKSYEFLTSLPEKANCENIVTQLLLSAPDIIDILDEDFVVNKMLSPLDEKFCKLHTEIIGLLASFVLCGKTEESQLQRYNRVLVPAMEHAFQMWNDVIKGEYYIKYNFNKLLKTLIWKFRVFVNLCKIPIPAKLFTEIKNKMEEKMPLLESYTVFTSWKLITEYVKLIDEHKSIFKEFETAKISNQDYGSGWMSEEIESVWKKIHFKVSPTLGPIIVKCLKEDTEKYFPSICWLFTDAFHKMFDDLSYPRDVFILETLKHMLNDEDFISSYLVVCNEIPKFCNEDLRKIRAPMRKKILSHPSKEVQIHYHRAFGDIPEDTI